MRAPGRHDKRGTDAGIPPKICLLASFAALVVIGGGHWAALQTVAWAQMIVDYTRDSGSLRQGVAQTFDGEHPCELCRQISAGIQKEKR